VLGDNGVAMPILVTRDFPPSRGGIQRYCEGLADALNASGHPVCVITVEQPNTVEYDTSRPFPIVRLPEQGRLLTGVRTIAAIADARHTIKDGRIIAAIWQPCGYEALIANYARDSRVTIVAHGSEITKQREGLRRGLASNVLRRADVVAVSRFTAMAVQELGASARVVPSGIVVRDYVRARSLQPTVLSVGRLVRRKGFDRLIVALPALAAIHPQVKLRIVGDGPDLPYLQNLARENGVSDRVTFHGQVSDEALADLYAAAWCFAMPNRTEEGYDAEGLGIVFLEAALHSVPAIGGRFSGAEDAIQDTVTGTLVDGRSQEEVTAALVAMLGHEEDAEAKGKAARQRVVRDFNWYDIARRVIA